MRNGKVLKAEKKKKSLVADESDPINESDSGGSS